MNPLPLADPYLATRRLVELLPERHLDVALHWQRARLGARLLEALTREIAAEARQCLIPFG